MRCPACGARTELDAQFCDACGASLAAPTAADAGVARKVVTILFADLIGSTSLQERLDAESTRRVMERYYAAMRAPVEAHGGAVVQLLGDGVLCAFGVPHVAEDDAIRAVRAAVAMQQAFREFRREEGVVVGDLGLRIAVNTGEVVVSDERPQGIGDPLNVAGRLQQEAREGDVLVGEATRRLVGEQVTLAHFGTFALKGRAEPVPAYRVVSLERPAGAPAIAFVGREDELRRLTSVYDAAVAAPGARLAAVLGSPGLGKSRLLEEFARRLGERATVLMARCDPAGGTTFAPLAGALRALLHVDDSAGGEDLRAAVEKVVPEIEPERARIAKGVAALLAGAPSSPEETFFVVRRLLAGLAMVQPVVLALDDVQWAEPLLLDLTEHLVQWSSGVPLLVLVAARPELRDTRSSLATPGGLVGEVVTLGGLDASAATRLAANVIGAEELPAAIAGRVLATSEGNPLFVGELVRMLVHDGALKRDGDRWTTGVALADVEMPPTIHALLAARIERLRPEERTVLERAAVVGRHFSRAAVAQLLPRELGDLGARIESLRRSELIEPDTGWFLGEPVLRFHHALIRDAAYRRVLRGTRAELHERFADWVAARVGDSVEHDETIGWHLEQAHQQLQELGPIDARGRALGERAARHLAAAGRRALARDDLPVASNLLGRALDRLDPSDPARAELALDRCESLLAAGDVAPAAAAIAELARFTAGSDRLRAWHTCFAGQLAALTDPQSLRATADAVAAAAQALAAAGDTAGEAKAHSVHALALQRLGKVGACEAALDLALAAARRVRDRRRANTVLAGAPLAALWGPSPVTRASGRCLDVVRVLRITQGAPAVEAVALRCQAVLEALRGRADAARRMLASSRRMVEELGLTPQLLDTDVFAGLIDLLEGDAAAAERGLRGAYDGLRERGLGIDAARAAALLARALLALDRPAEAEALSRESESLAGDDLHAAIAWRGALAEALARRGEHALAVDFARAAVEIAASTDALLDHADARSALATALRAAGRTTEADTEERRAIDLWEAKGATLLAERAHRGLVAVAPDVSARTAPPPPAARVHAKVRANAATAHAARLDAVVRARDSDALAQLLSDSVEIVHHPTRTQLGREGGVSMLAGLLRADDLSFSSEPLATLGESLVLCYVHSSLTALGGNDVAPFGAIDGDLIALMEVDGGGRQRRAELFAVDRLGDAIARLYQSHAELLPEGPERDRAAATARGVAAVLGVVGDPAEFRAILSPALEFVDHQQLGMGRARGADPVRRGNLVLHEVADRVTTRVDELLALRSDGLVACRTISGTDRTSGGSFERQHVELWTFGSDGLLQHLEHFDATAAAAAVARFGELGVESPATPVRRVRPNAATANAAGLGAAISGRDEDAFAGLLAADYEATYHPTGLDSDQRGPLNYWRELLQARHAELRTEELATLGDSLALIRQHITFTPRPTSEGVDVGAVVDENVTLIEVDAHGRARRVEVFDPNHLAVAVAQLYARNAERLPDGAKRDRACATARVVAVLMGPPALEPYHTAFAPDVEWADHRTLGYGSLRGRDSLLRAFRSLFDTADNLAVRVDDVLALEPSALLVRWTISGTDRMGGGAFERHFLLGWVFGRDGLVTRSEQFDAGRVDDALARLAELAAESPHAGLTRRVRPNAATANAARMDAAVAAQDFEAFRGLLRDDAEAVHHPTGVRYEESRALDNYRVILATEGAALRHEPLASLGDSLALFRVSLSLRSGSEDSVIASHGAVDSETVLVTQVDAVGLRRLSEFFAPGRLPDAVARIYELHAESLPEGSARTRAAAMARSVATMLESLDVDRFATAIAPDIEFADHGPIGIGPSRGAKSILRGLGALHELAAGAAVHHHDVLELRPDLLLTRCTTSGTDRASGGAFERHFLALWVFGGDGRATRVEWFAPDRESDALARIDELTATPKARRVRPNAATAHLARLDAAIAARDEGAIGDLFTASAEVNHRPTGSQYDRKGSVASLRALTRGDNLESAHEPLATLGESLALCRLSVSFRGLAERDSAPAGATEVENVLLVEVDARGRRVATEFFASDRLGDAVARLYERHAESLPEGAARVRAAATAESVSRWLKLFDDFERYVDPEVEFADHRPLGLGSLRGVELVKPAARAQLELAREIAFRVDDVRALRADAFLVRSTTSGVDRASGGAYERPLLLIGVFGPNGLATRVEWFEPERDVEALARFDELVASPGPVPRRVRANPATANAARLDAAAAARDFDGFKNQFADGAQVVHHPTGTRFEQSRNFPDFQRLLQTSSSFAFSNQPLATLGDSLALLRASLSIGGIVGNSLDVSATESEWFLLTEVDGAGRRRYSEFFATDHLGDAIACLYGRYAESLPDGPRRTRAAATARSVSAWMKSFSELERYASADVQFKDHRLLGLGSSSGVERARRALRTQSELARDVVFRIDDVCALRPDAFLLSSTTSGTDRASGGAYERVLLVIGVFDLDGLVTRVEWFEPGRETEALARFDELTAESAKSQPRVRANAASAETARLEAAVAARDADALVPLFAGLVEVVEHATGAVFDGRGMLEMWRALVAAEGPRFRAEMLATLGESLALGRSSMSFDGLRADDVGPFGAVAREEIALLEVGADGHHRRLELFAGDHLQDGMVRLYERYAELQPEGPARAAAERVARATRAMFEAPDLQRLARSFDPGVELVDRSSVGTWSAHGAEAALQHFRSLLEVAGDITFSDCEILRLETEASLVRRTHCGADRAGGGAYETRLILLMTFGRDGLLMQVEWFDADREAEALARFDELTAVAAPPRRRVRLNAATANAARLEAAIAARDAGAFPALFAANAESVHHPTGAVYDRSGVLASLRLLLDAQDLTFAYEPLATLGESLALCRAAMSHGPLASADFAPFGAAEMDLVVLIEVDARGARTRGEFFAADAMVAAIARLYERYAELRPEGPARERALATARSAGLLARPFDLDYSAVFARGVTFEDHRALGLGTMSGSEAVTRWLASAAEAAEDLAVSYDDILGLRPDMLLVRATATGVLRAGGGAFEQPIVHLFVVGANGRVTRMEWFEPGREADALARFDELAAEPPMLERRVRPNAATANAARLDAVFASRDVDAFMPHMAEDLVSVHHPTGTTYDRKGAIGRLHAALRAEDPALVNEPLATLGDSLALCRQSMTASGSAGRLFDIGAYEIENLNLIEVDAHGRRRRLDTYAVSRTGEAIARLYERYAELLPGGPKRTRAEVAARSIAILLAPFDLARVAESLAPEVEFVDRRPAGFGSLRGADALLGALESAFEVAEDLREHCDDVLAARPDALLLRWTTSGRERVGGGEFEWPHLRLCILGSDGRFTRIETFATDKAGDALARFDELAGASSPERFANAASRTMERFERAWRERDWPGVVATFVPTHRMDDRRRLMRMQFSGEDFLANERMLFQETASQWQHDLLATRGERLALLRMRFTAEAGGSGPMAVEMLDLVEVDSAGRRAVLVVFDLDDLEAAYAELDRRYVAGEGAPWAELIAQQRVVGRAFGAGNLAALTRLLPDDFTLVNHQRFGGTGERRARAQVIANAHVMADLNLRGDVRLDHLPRISAAAAVAATTWYGTRDGGAFETSQCVVCTHDGRQFHSWEIYDPDQLDRALARYEELSTLRETSSIENLATRAVARGREAWDARDWGRFVATFGAAFVHVDRRALVQLELARRPYLDSIRPFFEMAEAAPTLEVVATRGDRLALIRATVYVGTERRADLVGPSEIEFLFVSEVGEGGEQIAMIQFDANSLGARPRRTQTLGTRCGAAWWHLPRGTGTRPAHSLPPTSSPRTIGRLAGGSCARATSGSRCSARSVISRPVAPRVSNTCSASTNAGVCISRAARAAGTAETSRSRSPS